MNKVHNQQAIAQGPIFSFYQIVVNVKRWNTFCLLLNHLGLQEEASFFIVVACLLLL